MIDDLDAQLVFDIVAVVALVFAAGLIWRLIVAARTPPRRAADRVKTLSSIILGEWQPDK
jgi:hypothetical protein